MILELFRERLNPIEVRFFAEKDYNDLYALHYGNAVYNYCMQKWVTMEGVVAQLSVLPPNTSLEQKFYVGFYSDSLLGCMDFIRDYPDSDTVFIGLLMMDATRHRRGLGSQIITAFIDCARQAGYKKIRLGCLDNNNIAHSFWTKHGFIETERKPSGSLTIIVMEKVL